VRHMEGLGARAGMNPAAAQQRRGGSASPLVETIVAGRAVLHPGAGFMGAESGAGCCSKGIRRRTICVGVMESGVVSVHDFTPHGCA